MTDDAGDAPAPRAAEAVARRSYGRLVAYLAARTRDVAAAEDALSEAFAAALADWPRSGCPSNPEGWLMTVARRKLIDAARRRGSERRRRRRCGSWPRDWKRRRRTPRYRIAGSR